jgi:hypothetical protein
MGSVSECPQAQGDMASVRPRDTSAVGQVACAWLRESGVPTGPLLPLCGSPPTLASGLFATAWFWFQLPLWWGQGGHLSSGPGSWLGGGSLYGMTDDSNTQLPRASPWLWRHHSGLGDKPCPPEGDIWVGRLNNGLVNEQT